MELEQAAEEEKAATVGAKKWIILNKLNIINYYF